MITTNTNTRMKMRAPTPPTTASMMPRNSNIKYYHECASGQHIIECNKPCMGGCSVVMDKIGVSN